MRKIAILLFILAFYEPLQGKEGLRYHTGHVKEAPSPFLRHTEGCRSIGIIWHRMADDQLWYGIYYHMHLTPCMALRFSGGISSVRCNNKKHMRWAIAPSFLYKFFSAHEHHYISLALGPVIEYGSYQATVFGLPDRKGWDIRVALAPHYTFYFDKHWAICIGIGACIGFLKDKGASGLIGSIGLQYNL